ncbi:MAG TPA: hypothetical protein VKU41_32750, partial [Polyangiaceae bacterium]|nr:hypothetical protein [Polyangiaceae bacterium]
MNAPNGSACGTNEVCEDGACGACAQGAPCSNPPSPCHTGRLDCSSGAPLCTSTGAAVADGTRCGTGEVCLTGTCVACQEGQACTPPGEPCQTGSTSCATGTSVCVPTAQAAADGTSCGPNEVCKGGICGPSCAAPVSCPSSNPCQTVTTSCSGACDVVTNLPDNTPCGAGTETAMYCQSGACDLCVRAVTAWWGTGDSSQGTLTSPSLPTSTSPFSSAVTIHYSMAAGGGGGGGVATQGGHGVRSQIIYGSASPSNALFVLGGADGATGAGGGDGATVTDQSFTLHPTDFIAVLVGGGGAGGGGGA